MRVRAKTLRELNDEELAKKADELNAQLLEFRLRSRSVGIEKPAQLRALRRTLACVATIRQERHHG